MCGNGEGGNVTDESFGKLFMKVGSWNPRRTCWYKRKGDLRTGAMEMERKSWYTFCFDKHAPGFLSIFLVSFSRFLPSPDFKNAFETILEREWASKMEFWPRWSDGFFGHQKRKKNRMSLSSARL